LRGRNHRLGRRVLLLYTGLLLLLGIPATGPAQGPGVGALKEKSAALAARSQEAVVQLYALESRLQQARGDLARIDARAAALAQQQESTRRRHRAAQRTMAVAQFRLGRQLRILYEQDEPDPIAVLLGATSLDEAIEGLESISRTARATEAVIEQARSARTLIARTQRELAVRVSRTRAIRATVAATAAGLEQAQVERTAYLGQLRQEQQLTARQIASLQQQAQEAQQRAQLVTQQAVAAQPAAQQPSAQPAAAVPDTATPTISAVATTTAAPVDPSEPPPPPAESVSQGTPSSPPTTTGPPRPGRTMSVLATGYCLKGTTATGLPVGPGIVAVDPTVIPLGTRMSIPGYGEGVAADTGSGVTGAHIDVWIASCTEAIKFTRTVTITFH
jgi:3D (Asp-Asp-Asp) domain-containing protein/peptidoglycan hydrolase CwlO-like protein